MLFASCRPRRAKCASTAVVVAIVPLAACMVGVGRG